VIPDEAESPVPGKPRRLARGAWFVLGLFFTALGFIGALLPLMPTTIFLILAAGCFARSSPRLEAWLLNHRQFGPTLRAWRTQGAISKRGKIMACSGITLGFIMFWIGARPGIWLDLLVGGLMAACAAYILTRPTARPSE
jgi:uncharacterized membrane protein YbaN (DUF454 family)